MPSDFNKREPSKTEKLLYQMTVQLQSLNRSTMSNSAQFLALACLLDVKPEKLAEMLVKGDEKLREYGKKINEEITKLEQKEHPDGHDHNHDGYDHAGHEHPHS